jgi:hypothetical protein
METCPICRARLNGATICRRCRAELGIVQALELRGQALTVAALQALARGDSAGAAHWLGRARWVHATPMVRVLEWVVDALGQAADAVPATTEERAVKTWGITLRSE